MSSLPGNPSEDDVKRLLKQMKMDAFQFRSFNRPVEDDGNEFDAASHQADDAPAPEAAPAPTRPVVAAAARAAATLVVAPPPPRPDGAVAVGEAFGRLIREPEPRLKRKATLQLNLPPRPRIVDVKPAATGELLLTDVLNRLYRLGTAKISLVRHRGDA